MAEFHPDVVAQPLGCCNPSTNEGPTKVGRLDRDTAIQTPIPWIIEINFLFYGLTNLTKLFVLLLN